jgi:hypothetical protein
MCASERRRKEMEEMVINKAMRTTILRRLGQEERESKRL